MCTKNGPLPTSLINGSLLYDILLLRAKYGPTGEGALLLLNYTSGFVYINQHWGIAKSRKSRQLFFFKWHFRLHILLQNIYDVDLC